METNESFKNIDKLFKKISNNKNTTTNLNDVRLKRQISIDKIRYEQGLALENKLNQQQNSLNISQAVEKDKEEVKIEPNIDLANVKIENLNDVKIENELNSYFTARSVESEADSDIEIIENVINDKKPEEIVLSSDDDEDDDVILLDKDELAEELRFKLKSLSINKIIKVEQPWDDGLVKIKEEKTEETPVRTTIMLDSMLGTISGQNDQFINELAEQLAANLNLPFEFMTVEEFEKYKESQNILTNNNELSNDDLNSEVLLTNNESETEINNNDTNQSTIKIKGHALIQYLFGDCSDSLKNAISRRDSTLSELRTRFDNLKNQRKTNSKPVSYYITKKKLRKLEFQRKFKKLENQLHEIEKNRNEILAHLYVDHNMNQNFNNDNYIIIDISLYKNFLYTCTLSGRCNVYNLLNHRLINSTTIDEGANFIQPLYNDSRFYLSVIIGGGSLLDEHHQQQQQTRLHVYDSILKHRKFSIDLKSQIRCVVFRYHRLYCGLNSGEIISLNRNLNNFDKPIKVTDKKISAIGVALINFEKLLLVGAYDGKIHILQTKTHTNDGYEYQNDYLTGHKMPPLSIKCYTEYIYSCSADCHILVHSLHTYQLVSKLDFKSPITSLIIQHSTLLSSGADGLIRCYSLNNPKNLILCQQYYGYNKKSRVMCMKCENNFIYYGDDKGYVESIELNFQKRHNCMIESCTEPFATTTYLLEHILQYHYKSETTSLETIVKCDWHTCNQLVEFKNLKVHLLRHL